MGCLNKGITENHMSWTPSSWRDFPILQVPEYADANQAKQVEQNLAKKPPLVFAGEVQNLRGQLASVAMARDFCCKAEIVPRVLPNFLPI